MAQVAVREHLVGRACGVDAAAIEQQQPVAVHRGEVQVVQHHRDREPASAAQLANGIEQNDRVLQVEERGWLVEQQQTGVLRQRTASTTR